MPRFSEKQAQLDREVPLAERVYLRPFQAAVLFSLSLNRIEELIASGRLNPARVGKFALIERKALERLLKKAQRERIPSAREERQS